MEILKERYSITELSQRLSVTDHALRYYEKEFGLSIPKDSRGRRYYTPEMANIMFKIKSMRDEGLEIKAIKNILSEEGSIGEPPPVVTDGNVQLPVQSGFNGNTMDIMTFFNDFKDQLTLNITAEVVSAREQITRELNRTKLELGACVENSARKLEAKMEKHFLDVDRSLSNWREKNRGGPIRRLFRRMMK